MLDDKFWVWETLEEAARPELDSLSPEDLDAIMTAFAANFKGSEDIWDLYLTKQHAKHAKLF